jgi:5-methylcytosine-specific restriction endonuclease McrA
MYIPRRNRLKKEIAMEQVIVLNADFSFLNVVSVERAFLYIAKGKVSVEKYTDSLMCTAEEVFRKPRVVRFVKMIHQVFKKKIPWSRRNVFVRDKNVCQYCGTTNGKMTIDHIFPKSRGGKNTFINTVTACFDCNNWKDDRTPGEAVMSLLREPKAPSVSEFIRLTANMLTPKEIMKELGFGE